MSGTKAALKAINAAVQSQKYDEAVEQAQKLLDSDPNSYQAQGGEPQAWQGLIQLYEKQGGPKVEQYQTAALQLAQIYQAHDDKYKCQDVIDKFLAFAKNEGSRLQHRKSLEVILPDSPVYQYLEGRVHHPSHTYQIIAQITEFEEKERINKEIGERRTRLGARIGQVTVEVKREVLKDSDLEEIYNKIIDWTTDDEIRRQYEEKLIQRCLDTLVVLPLGDSKTEKRSKLFKLATDMVLIKHPYKLAWDIAIEWQDPEYVQGLDVNNLREYIDFFPTSGLAQVLRGFMTSEISPFPPPPRTPAPTNNEKSDESSSDEDDGGGVTLDDFSMLAEDRLAMMIGGMTDSPTSVLAHRLMGEYYQFLDEHESVVELMRNANRLASEESNKIGKKFKNASQSFKALLGTALVFYQSPKNHPEAKALFDGLLKENPTSTPALIGIGLIYEEEDDFVAAIDFLERALQRDPTNIRVKAEAAWVKAINGDYIRGREELEECLPRIEAKDMKSRDLLAQTQYRVGVCLWNIDTSKSARKDRKGAYSYFLASLKSNLNFAPAYTSLGIFYADYSNDKKRSRKCFQKAFELSSSEVEAAERLARIFAGQGEWELVESVAQRVVNSGKVRPAPGSKKKGISWPFAALGTAELNKQDYSKSIVSFQSALRITPSDYHSWVGLGESYHNSGRYIAATKAFNHAEQFESEIEQRQDGETWFAKHMLANVKRELGSFDDAIEGYKSVLQNRPAEFGVSIALIQTLVDSAWDSIEKGLLDKQLNVRPRLLKLLVKFLKAELMLSTSGELLAMLVLYTPGFGPHRRVSRYVDGVSVDVVLAKGLFSADEEDGVRRTRCLHAAILAHKRAIHASSHDTHAQAVAYYNLGWIEHRAHVCLAPSLKKKSTRYQKAAVRCFKRAIELEAGNSEFWNALGIVTSDLNPKVAQHSFVRSLYLNERSAQTWTNLGSLYLQQNDHQLANDAFTRAQATDPDYSHAWIGQGLLALMLGDVKEANLLFTHAMEISGSSSLITHRQYSQSTFDQVLAAKNVTNVADLVQPLFVLNRVQSMAPDDLVSKHLSSLFSERARDISSAVTTLTTICGAAEADYEVTESPESLSRFALAKADLARSQLANEQYEEAVESGDLALQLCDEDSGNELSAEDRQKCRLSAHLTVGLAHYYLKNLDTALEYFEPALKESKGNPDAVCVLAQVLWAHGTESSRSKAQDILYECVESHPNHVQSVLLLGIIALFNSDTEGIEAVTAELQTLRTDKLITDAEQARVGEVLRSIAAFSEEDSEIRVMSEVQKDVILHPGSTHGWSRLANITGDVKAAEMAVLTAKKSIFPRGVLGAEELSTAYAGTGKVGDAQRGIMVAPWKKDAWDAFSNGISA
ncbi:tetratricopeptide [Botrytis cinerea]